VIVRRFHCFSDFRNCRDVGAQIYGGRLVSRDSHGRTFDRRARTGRIPFFFGAEPHPAEILTMYPYTCPYSGSQSSAINCHKYLIFMEHRAGIEPAKTGFADQHLSLLWDRIERVQFFRLTRNGL
jgi:hypothetical protein